MRARCKALFADDLQCLLFRGHSGAHIEARGNRWERD